MDSHVRISSDIERHLDWIAEDVAMGFDEIYLHNVGRNQLAFIETFGAHIKAGNFPECEKAGLGEVDGDRASARPPRQGRRAGACPPRRYSNSRDSSRRFTRRASSVQAAPDRR